MVQFGWEKALGGPGAELAWWEARAAEGARWLWTEAYDGRAAGWDSVAGIVYRPLARALVQSAPSPLGGRSVLDVGSGTGAVAEAAEAAGARVFTADGTLEMVAFPGGRWPAVAADAAALPFRPGAFDAAVAGFVLNHLKPATALAEMARVVRPGGVVLASTWATMAADPVKSAIDEVLSRWGWSPPAWYRAMKAEIWPISGDPDRLASEAEAAGLAEVTAAARHVDIGPLTAADVVAYRLSVPQVATVGVRDWGTTPGLGSPWRLWPPLGRMSKNGALVSSSCQRECRLSRAGPPTVPDVGGVSRRPGGTRAAARCWASSSQGRTANVRATPAVIHHASSPATSPRRDRSSSTCPRSTARPARWPASAATKRAWTS